MLKSLIIFLVALVPGFGEIIPQECPERLYAVHATSILPKGNILRAGLGRQPFQSTLAQRLYPDLRATVHFSLGELVRPIQVGEKIYGWEESPYAIVIPLKNLLYQTISLNCYDLFTLGSVSLDSEEVTLVIPEGDLSLLPEDRRYAVRTYDPALKRVREVVDEVIEMKRGWHVRMSEGRSEDDLNPAFVEGTRVDINHREFFSSLKSAYPHISIVGLRWRPLEGEGYLFGLLEQQTAPLIHALMDPSFSAEQPPVIDIKDFENQLFALYETVAKIDRFVRESPYLMPQKMEYEEKRMAIETWLNILMVELELNRMLGKTLRGAPPKIWEEVDAWRHSLHTLRSQLWEISSTLNDYDALPLAA